MNKKILKILLNFVLISIITFTISTLIYSHKVDYADYHQGTVIEQKIDSATNSNYNVIAIGSSITFRHFDPVVFDSINSECVSFNAGIPGLRPFAAFDYVKSVIDYDNRKEKYDLILLEISDYDILGPNFNKAPYKYSIDLEKYKLALKYPFETKTYYKDIGGSYTKLFFHKYYGFGASNHVFLSLGINPLTSSPFVLPVNNSVRGYKSACSMLNASDYRVRNYYIKLQNDYVNSETHNTDSIIKIYKSEFKYIEPKDNVLTNYYTEFLNEIRKKTERLVLIVPPRGAHLESFLNLKYVLIKNGFEVWDYTNPEENQELYTSKYSFDLYHLNDIGAKLYTKKLANRYKRMILEEKVSNRAL